MSPSSVGRSVAWRGGDGAAHYSDGEPGPAGVARLELAGGTIVLTVDYLEPATIVGLDLHDPDPDHLRALATLLGRPSLGRDELPDDGSPLELRIPLGIKLGTRPLHPLVALAALTADIEEAPFDPFGLGTALLEAAALVERLPGEIRRLLGDVDPWATRGRGARLVLDADPDDVWLTMGPAQRPRVVRLLLGAAETLGGTDGAALRDLAAGLLADGTSSLLAAADMAPSPLPAAAAVAGAAAPAALQLVPALETAPEGRPTDCAFTFDPNVGVDEAGVLRSEGHLDAWIVGEVLCDPWLRIMRVRGSEPPVPLGVAPFVDDGSGLFEASVLVSDSEIDTDLVVEVTPAPLDVPVGGRLSAVRHACALGRAAERARRAEFEPTSVQLWMDCATAWRELGDDRRADAANGHVRRAGYPPRSW